MLPNFQTAIAAHLKSLFGYESHIQKLAENEEHKLLNDGSGKFRLLIIGKSGCGKTTILSKVCGEEVADKPSSMRGTHNIEKEMQFSDNELFIVHDSEGFEAGQEDEYQVVENFIKSRGRNQDIDVRLHAIWYCLTTNSRPIQEAEEKFFSKKHDVPIVAVFTKFDLFIENELQELMENCDELEDEATYYELERQAEQIASEKFETHFKDVLLRKSYPPQAVIALHDVHNSTLSNPRLTELISATMTVLRADSRARSKNEQQDTERLATLFAAAQQVDLPSKYKASIFWGSSSYVGENYTRYMAEVQRFGIIRIWSEHWNARQKRHLLMEEFKKHVEEHPLTFGNLSHMIAQGSNGQELTPLELEACRCFQLAADFTIIMAELFLLSIKDEPSMRDIVAKYPSTPAFTYIQEHAVEILTSVKYDKLGIHKDFYVATSLVDSAVQSLLSPVDEI